MKVGITGSSLDQVCCHNCIKSVKLSIPQVTFPININVHNWHNTDISIWKFIRKRFEGDLNLLYRFNGTANSQFFPCLLAPLAGRIYPQSIIIDKLFVGEGCTIEGADEGCRCSMVKITHCVFVLYHCDSAPLEMLVVKGQGFSLNIKLPQYCQILNIPIHT